MMPPPASASPAGFAPPAAALTSRRPIGPLIVCVAVLLAVVATAGAFMTMRSLAAAGRLAHKANPSMVAAGPKANPGEFVVAPQPNLNVKPPTPAANPQPTVQPPVIIKQPVEPQMPADVLAYLSWLAQQNESRKTAEKDGLNAVTELIDKLLTGGMGSDFTDREDSPAPENMQAFDQWNDRLTALHQNASTLAGLDDFWRTLKAPGSPHVPQQCVLLHGMYVNAMGLQRDTAGQLKVFVLRRDMADVQNQKKVGRRAEEMLRRANAELGRVCSVYHRTPWFDLSPTSGDVPSIPALP
jgi:hypothetical protein